MAQVPQKCSIVNASRWWYKLHSSFWGFKMRGRSGYVIDNNPDYYNNNRNITWSQAWLRGHDEPGQISTHPVQQNIFSARSQEHIVSCPVDAPSWWKPVFHKKNLASCFIEHFTELKVIVERKKKKFNRLWRIHSIHRWLQARKGNII